MTAICDARGIVTGGPPWASESRKAPGPTPGNWQLEAGHYEGYFDMTFVYPRPDSETHPSARHRVNYTGQFYEIPIGIFGGKRPLHCDITGPEGMYVEQYGDHDKQHMTLKWPISVAGTHNVSLAVWDQDAVLPVTVSFELVVSTNWNVLDGSAEVNGDGTIESPYNTLASVDDNRPVLITGGPIDWEDKVTSLDYMSRTWLAADGVAPEMLQALSSIGNTPGTSDFFFGGLTFKIPPDRLAVGQFFRWEGASRTIFFKNIFDAESQLTVGAPENAAMVMWTNQGVGADDPGNGWYCMLHSNLFRNIRARDTYIGYSQRFMISDNDGLENCDASSGGHGHYPKTNVADFGCYGLYTIGDNNTMKGLRIDDYTGNFPMDRYDTCYLSIKFYGEDTSGDGTGAVSCSHEFTGTATERYFYRSSIQAPNAAPFHARGMTSESVLTYSNNVTMSGNPPGGSFVDGVWAVQFQGALDIQGAQHGNNESGLLDDANNIAGDALPNLGLKGAQIA